MNEELTFYVPKTEDLWYRQKLLEDAKTMSYNKGYELGFPEYDNETGCILFPKEKWESWAQRFLRQEPEKFYAYIVRKSDGAWIGDVNLHLHPSKAYYDMGILLDDEMRQKGYAQSALALLLEKAFTEFNANAVRNEFEATRSAADKIHRALGFEVIDQQGDMQVYEVTKERYFQLR